MSDELRAWIAAARARCEAATPGPWCWNSYSAVHSEPMARVEAALEDEHEAAGEPYDEKGEPAGEWAARFREAESRVASVPPAYGDTATGRQAADADFIAASRTDLPRALDHLERLLDRLEAAHGERDRAVALAGRLHAYIIRTMSSARKNRTEDQKTDDLLDALAAAKELHEMEETLHSPTGGAAAERAAGRGDE